MSVFELSLLETVNLIAVMNKMNPIPFVRLRQATKFVNEFVDEHRQLIGVETDSKIKFFYKTRLEAKLYNGGKYYNILETELERHSGFSFRHLSLDNVDFESLKKDFTAWGNFISFLKRHIWRKTYLSQEGVEKEILLIVKPFWLFAIVSMKKSKDEEYIQWLDDIISIPQINRLVYGIMEYRGPKILEMVFSKWCSSSLGNLQYVVPGMNFTFCNVENWKTVDMLETIKRRHLKEVFETIENFLAKGQYEVLTEVYEENHLPAERYTENVEIKYKPVGIIKIKCNKGGNACLAVEVTQYGEKEFNVAFCFYTQKDSVDEYEKRMRELLLSE